MGSLLSRATSNRSEGKKAKWRKGKRKHTRNMETSIDSENFHTQNNNEQEHSNGNLINTYEDWNKRIDQQQLASNHNDPSVAPSNYVTNYPAIQNDLINQSWSSPHDANNQFYQVNSHPMTITSSVPYDSNQFAHTQIPNTFVNQPQQVILEERASKKVQFARPLQQQPPSSSKTPLTSTQSWHELSAVTNDTSLPSTRQESSSNRQSLHRSVMPTASTQASQQKPIYVGIDHKATLAERGQTKASKRHHKNGERNNSDGVDSTTTSQRTRSHTHHQHKTHELNDISTSKNTMQSNRSVEPLQVNSSNAPRTLTTTSTSTMIPNKLEQPIINDTEMKIPKTRGIRHPAAQHVERHSPVENEIKSSRSKKPHSQRREHHHQHGTTNRSNSPLRNETTRRVENKHPGSPNMRIPVSQQQHRQKQSTVTNPATTNRTRV